MPPGKHYRGRPRSRETRVSGAGPVLPTGAGNGDNPAEGTGPPEARRRYQQALALLPDTPPVTRQVRSRLAALTADRPVNGPAAVSPGGPARPMTTPTPAPPRIRHRGNPPVSDPVRGGGLVRVASVNWHGGIDPETGDKAAWRTSVEALQPWRPDIILCQEISGRAVKELTSPVADRERARHDPADRLAPPIRHRQPPAILFRAGAGLEILGEGPTAWPPGGGALAGPAEARLGVPGLGQALRAFSDTWHPDPPGNIYPRPSGCTAAHCTADHSPPPAHPSPVTQGNTRPESRPVTLRKEEPRTRPQARQPRTCRSGHPRFITERQWRRPVIHPPIYFIPRFSPHFFSSPERKRKRKDSAMTSQIPDQMPLPGPPATDGARHCKQPGCGAELPAATGRGAPRLFCSPACSRKWHNDSRVSPSPPPPASRPPQPAARCRPAPAAHPGRRPGRRRRRPAGRRRPRPGHRHAGRSRRRPPPGPGRNRRRPRPGRRSRPGRTGRHRSDARRPARRPSRA